MPLFENPYTTRHRAITTSRSIIRVITTTSDNTCTTLVSVCEA